MVTGMVISLVVIFVLLILSAFFSGSETAFTAVSQARMHAAEKDGDARAALVNKIVNSKDRMIGALLLGNNVVNITASSMAAGVLISIFGESGVFYASAVMTVLIVIFVEVLPKTYAFYHADSMARFVAPMVQFFIYIFSPITSIITRIVRASLLMIGVDVTQKTENGSHLEVLRGVIDMHRGDDVEIVRQRAMLRSVLDLADVAVLEIMTHRKNVMMLDIDDPVPYLVDEIMKCPYSRIPLYRGSPDNIIGVIHTKWLMRELKAVQGNMDSINLEILANDPWYIPSTTVLFDQLQAFRDRGEHFAFIVDEYGTFEGIVTLEDILEEIVGEISDEHDMRMTGVRRQRDGSFIVSGEVTIRDLRRELEWELPDDTYSTVSGLIIYESRDIPRVGQSFRFYGYTFEITRRHRNQITQVRILPPSPSPQAISQ